MLPKETVMSDNSINFLVSIFSVINFFSRFKICPRNVLCMNRMTVEGYRIGFLIFDLFWHNEAFSSTHLFSKQCVWTVWRNRDKLFVRFF